MAAAAQADAGRIEGRVVQADDGRPVEGVTVVLDDAAAALTDADGRYRFTAVDAARDGGHTIALSLGSYRAQERIDALAVDATARVETRVDWPLAIAETIVVRAASRRAERIVEAPSSVSVVTEQAIARQATHGQLPKLLAAAPGVELTQSGLYDLNLNARGFNGFVNRRVLTRIDGRDPSLPVFSGGQEWAALPVPLDAFERIEMVRGPGAALYGAGAFNGVLNLTTRAPRDRRGSLRLTGGERDLARVDLQHAEVFAPGWFGRLTASRLVGDDFTRARVDAVEYPGLPPEVVAPTRSRNRIDTGSLRVDRVIGDRTVVVEAGTAAIEGTTILTSVGRTERTDVARPWARVSVGDARWNVLATYTGRRDDASINLGSGAPTYLDSERLTLEVQGNVDFAQTRGRLVLGASIRGESTDSADPQGRQTVFAESETSQHEAVFGQVDYRLLPWLKLVGSLRWDHSTLHDDEFSPRLALVASLSPRQTVRLSYGRAFQSPSLAEIFLNVDVLPPFDLSFIERELADALDGVALGFGAIPVRAVGSDVLDTEGVRGFEVGYQGIFGRGLVIDAVYYRSTLDDFTSTLVPVLGTSLGTLGNFRPYAPPSSLSPGAAAAVSAALDAALPPGFLLAQDGSGAAFVPFLTYASVGEAETQGVELGARHTRGAWTTEVSYAWFDFDIKRQVAESVIAPNAPEHRAALELTYAGPRLSVGARARWVSDFDWRVGIFDGPVESYTVVDLDASFDIDARWRVRLSIANLLDDSHYEVFGGDVLARRALVALDWRW